jgi:hypothetical protein
LKSLARHLTKECGYPCEISLWPIEMGHETLPRRVAADKKYNRDCRGRCSGRTRGGNSICQDYIYAAANQIGRQLPPSRVRDSLSRPGRHVWP